MKTVKEEQAGFFGIQKLRKIPLKTLRSSFESLRTNGGACEIVGDFPFMLSTVEAFLGFFSGIAKVACTL